ncbi:hypothetical protein SKAU_G00100620 [Synaphobranchus kaupii]|uniref:Uncharacterized protein n=1 Tax=Synaphobranchus kaupii TaxID=118154 RepID=A0A9Q1FZ33_SYNKA|nr:hypothetical protein SKAU_G00100620 [Synaphobranchus kaupii]
MFYFLGEGETVLKLMAWTGVLAAEFQQKTPSTTAMATTPPRASDLGGTDPQTLPLAERQIREQLEGMHYASIKHSPQSVKTPGQDGAAG